MRRENIVARMKAAQAADELKALKNELAKLVTQNKGGGHNSVKSTEDKESGKEGLESAAIIENIAEKLQRKLHKLPRISLKEMSRAKVGAQKLSLLQPDILRQIKASRAKPLVNKLIGPLQQGPYTVYVEVQRVTYPKTALAYKKTKTRDAKQNEAHAARLAKSIKNDDETLANEFITYIIDEEAKRGNFVLKLPEKDKKNRPL